MGKTNITASDECPGCGGVCSSSSSPLRNLNPITENCVDYLDPTGKPWRDNYGYTCDAYHYGGFCTITNDGKYEEGGLWNVDKYGKIATYKWWADDGTGFPNSGAKLDAFGACCTCGGGKTATIGSVLNLETRDKSKKKKTRVLLKWEAPDETGVYTYVAIIRELHNDNGHKVYETGKTKVMLKKLKPKTHYFATVFAKSSNGNQAKTQPRQAFKDTVYAKSDGNQGLVATISFSTA